MVTGKIVIIFENDGATLPRETEYIQYLSAAFEKIFIAYERNDISVDYAAYGKTDAESYGLTPSVFPTMYFQIDGVGITELTGWRNSNEMYKFLYASLKGKAKETGSGEDPTTGGLPFGLDANGYAFERKCNPVDDFLRFLHLGTPVKRGLYAAGGLFFAYNALRSPNNLMIAANGGLSAGFLYLFFGKEDCPFDIPTLERNAKTIVAGGAISVGLLAFYQFYWKDKMQERRLTRIIRTATAATKPTAAKTKASGTARRRATKVKSVTTTKRY